MHTNISILIFVLLISITKEGFDNIHKMKKDK